MKAFGLFIAGLLSISQVSFAETSGAAARPTCLEAAKIFSEKLNQPQSDWKEIYRGTEIGPIQLVPVYSQVIRGTMASITTPFIKASRGISRSKLKKLLAVMEGKGTKRDQEGILKAMKKAAKNFGLVTNPAEAIAEMKAEEVNDLAAKLTQSEVLCQLGGADVSRWIRDSDLGFIDDRIAVLAAAAPFRKEADIKAALGNSESCEVSAHSYSPDRARNRSFLGCKPLPNYVNNILADGEFRFTGQSLGEKEKDSISRKINLCEVTIYKNPDSLSVTINEKTPDGIELPPTTFTVDQDNMLSMFYTYNGYHKEQALAAYTINEERPTELSARFISDDQGFKEISINSIGRSHSACYMRW